MTVYTVELGFGWDCYFAKLDNSLKKPIMKKILQLQGDVPARHLKSGLHFFVVEVGQYRLCYELNESTRTKTVVFIGDHKQYEHWIGLR